MTAQLPDAGASDTVDLAGGLGDQFGRFLLRVAGGVALARQTHDQLLLGT